MTLTLAHEASTVQATLLQHAATVGWSYISESEALARRGGEQGLFFTDVLRAALLRLNPGIVMDENVAQVIASLEAIPPTLDGNRQMLEWLRGKRTVFVPWEKRHRHVRLIDFDHPLDPAQNIFQATPEWAFRQHWKKGNRPDVMFLINGIPVALVECKNPKLSNAMEKALLQLRRYEMETPEMLAAPQVFNITHLIEYFYGVTWNTGRKNIFNWKTDARAHQTSPSTPSNIVPFTSKLTDQEPIEPTLRAAEVPQVTYAEAVQSFFDRARFLTLLREWILFYVKDDELQKTILRQHQTRAAVKVVQRCHDPAKRRGLVWHTQGSGKTFTMITAARLLLEPKNTHLLPEESS